jgi:hypothetical protein
MPAPRSTSRNTAVLQEIGGQYFAVDPALVDVGVPPPIIPLDSCIAHWPPDLAASEAPVRLRVGSKLITASTTGFRRTRTRARGLDMRQFPKQKALANERKYPNIVELTFPANGLEFEFNRRIIEFHKSRHI